jgi:hypothetical protein
MPPGPRFRSDGLVIEVDVHGRSVHVLQDKPARGNAALPTLCHVNVRRISGRVIRNAHTDSMVAEPLSGDIPQH